MTLRRAHGLLLAALSAALLLAFTAPRASAAIEPAPGGPILVVTTASDHFGSYYAEILRNEGLNDFDVQDISALSASTLNGHDTVILSAPGVSDAQVSLLTSWVNSGGNLIAMRPSAKLGPLLGLASPSGILSEGNLKIDTSQAPGKGITSSVIQYHGTADRWALAGARAVATLYSDVSTATANPAVTAKTVGHGTAAAFTYDLARSVVGTRQGNVAWAGQNRDREFVSSNPDPLIRSNDLFFGGNEPDWVDLNRVAIPQADEQQRLLANFITQLSYTPAPRFWYFPRGEKAVLALTGDDHGSGGTNGAFDKLLAHGPAGCRPPIDRTVVDNWDCVRATSYVYPDNTIIEPQVADNWDQYGFEIAAHPLFQADGSCLDFTWASLNATLDSELAMFASKFPGVPAPRTTRTHCIAWSDWSSQPKADAARGIRLNADYYYFSGTWTQNRPGLFTGSGMPMRFADTDGSLIDVYQAATYGADDATRIDGNTTDPATSPNAVIPTQGAFLMDNALGANGYYGAFTFQVHSDEADSPARDALVSAALARGVPVISEVQLLDWLDARNASTFEGVTLGADGKMRFTVDAGTGARGLQAMLPIHGRSGDLTGVTRNGQTVAYTPQTIKGVDYAILPNAAGDYVATYPAPQSAFPRVDGPGPGPVVNNPNPGTTPNTTTNPGSGVAGKKVTTKKVVKWVTAGSLQFRPGAKRSFVLTVRMPRTARLAVTIRSSNGKVVRRLNVSKRKAGTLVRIRWNGKDARGRYVKAGKYTYSVTALASKYQKSAKGSVRLLTAR